MPAHDHLSGQEFGQLELPLTRAPWGAGVPSEDWGRELPWDSRETWGGLPEEGAVSEEWGGLPGSQTWEMKRHGGLVHRSGHHFEPGDVVMSAEDRGIGTNFSVSSPKHAYASPLETETIWEETSDGREILSHSMSGHEQDWLGYHAHRVKPLSGAISHDPNMEGRRSRVGFEVLGDYNPPSSDGTTEVEVPPLMRGYHRTMGY